MMRGSLALTLAIATTAGATLAADEDPPALTPAAAPSPDQAANQLADEVFASEDFWWKRTEQVDAPSFLGTIFAAIYEHVLKPILEALGDLIQAILEWLAGLTGIGGDWSSGVPLLWFVVAILAGIVIWRVVVVLRRPRVAPAVTAPGTVADTLARADQLLLQAQAAFNQGHHRDAVRLAFLALISHLQERGRLAYDPSRSNREYQRDLRPWPDTAAGFRACAEPFERCWYGGRCPESAEVGSMISLCRQQLSLNAVEG